MPTAAPLYVVVAIVALLIIWIVAMYNTLVRLRQHCKESWSGIDTELQRRYDLIPNLVETVRATPPTSAKRSNA